MKLFDLPKNSLIYDNKNDKFYICCGRAERIEPYFGDIKECVVLRRFFSVEKETLNCFNNLDLELDSNGFYQKK